MSIGKLNASLVGGPTQETTLALANLSFDFALCKVEAPIEYQGLGQCLSKRRRDAAETGNEHILARKLGALFSHVLPPAPNLVRAYGRRSSEIVQEISSRGSPAHSRDGVFKDWAGPDATNIWAAATSGNGAIAAHLLACMLARIWSPSEAEAIWDEIIQARKNEILTTDPADPIWPSMEFAGRIEITRDQISRWNSSARAWLEVADNSRMRQQKQLELLVQRAGIPVNQIAHTYRSVKSAWITALTTLEKLLEGLPQSITEGSIMLALTSWHLYPDMSVLGSGSHLVRQNDPLFPSGTIITLGQSSRPPDADCDVFWSLPLAYLKYYGDPVIRTRSLGEGTSRLSFTEFMQVNLGAVLANWGGYGRETEQACENIIGLANFLSGSKRAACVGSRSWIELLSDAAESYLAAPAGSYTRGLTLRGYRRYGYMLSGSGQEFRPLFGLTGLNTMLRIMTHLESKIALLRLIAEGLAVPSNEYLLIRFAIPLERRQITVNSLARDIDFARDTEAHASSFLEALETNWGFATALKEDRIKTRKRKFAANADLHGHKQWYEGAENHVTSSGEEHISIEAPAFINGLQFRWGGLSPRSMKSSGSILGPKWEFILGDPDDVALFKLETVNLIASDELQKEAIDTSFLCNWINRDRLLELLDCRGKFSLHTLPFYLQYLRSLAAAAEAYKLMPGATIATDVFSVPLNNALWLPSSRSRDPHNQTTERSNRDVEITTSLTSSSTINPSILVRGDTPPRETSSIDTWHQGHGNVPNTHMFQREYPEQSTHGIPENEIVIEDEGQTGTQSKLITYHLSKNQLFSCIAMFENRQVNIEPNDLEQVMAISAGNSIYVSMPLICDPFDLTKPNEVKHITGNIGKPGISLMIPPIAPKVRAVDEENWTVINHSPFDGRMDDAFQHTSLHLSFTGYQSPMMAARHGYQGVEANFVETLVSIFDKDRWIADLDILRALAHPSLARLSPDDIPCQHKPNLQTPGFQLSCIDSWDEFTDRPSNACIFRASRNWLARLSAATLNAQRDFTTIILKDTDQYCWKCIRKHRILADKQLHAALFVW